MSTRQCPILQKSLDWCEGMPQLPGVRRRIYFINKNLIVDWPELTRDEFGRAADAKYIGNFTLAEDATWQYIDINIDKSTVTSEPQGEVPSQTQLNKATFVHNGIDAAATAAAGFLNNADCVFIYEDMKGNFRVLGNNKYRTKTSVSQDQGQGTNPASTTITVEVTDLLAPPFFLGAIETEDGAVMPHSEDATPTPEISGLKGIAKKIFLESRGTLYPREEVSLPVTVQLWPGDELVDPPSFEITLSKAFNYTDFQVGDKIGEVSLQGKNEVIDLIVTNIDDWAGDQTAVNVEVNGGSGVIQKWKTPRETFIGGMYFFGSDMDEAENNENRKKFYLLTWTAEDIVIESVNIFRTPQR